MASDYVRASGSLDTIIIDKGFDQPIRIAIPPFSSDVPEGLIESLAQISDVIAFDLARSGQFSPMSEADMLTKPTRLERCFHPGLASPWGGLFAYRSEPDWRFWISAALRSTDQHCFG